MNNEFDKMLAGIDASPPDAVFAADSPEALSMDMVRNAVACAKRKIVIRPVTINGRAFYPVIVLPLQWHLLACAQARSDWHDYYRAVRMIRRIHKLNTERSLRFRRCVKGPPSS